MMSVGIDKIGFATSQYTLKLADLARARQAEPEKYSQGLLLDRLSITPVTEDIITLASSAADGILNQEERSQIDMVILATESSVDQSKAAAIYVHQLLAIQPFARSFEVKEACYSATAALNYAKLHVEKSPTSKVLVIASDIAKYGIETPGEATQGAGAVAILVTSNPRIMVLHDDNLAQTRDVMDFWRPNYAETPFVNGMFSTKQYLDALKTTWSEYQKQTQSTLADFAAFCFHLPFPKLALKGLHKLMNKSLSERKKEALLQSFNDSILYSQQVGNIYTGSLYLGLLSLLENGKTLKAGDKIGLFSYGSGAVSEIFSGHLVEGYQNQLRYDRLEQLKQRQVLSVTDYEKLFYEEIAVNEAGDAELPLYQTGLFALTAIKQHQRQYQKVTENDKDKLG